MTVNNYHMLSNHSMVKQQVQRYLKDYNEATNKNILLQADKAMLQQFQKHHCQTVMAASM